MGLQPPFPQIHPQSQPLSQQTESQIQKEYPNIKRLGTGDVEIELILPNLVFPTNKNKLIKASENYINLLKQAPSRNKNITKILTFLELNLLVIKTLIPPNKIYKDVYQLEEEIIDSPKDKLSQIFIKLEPGKKIVSCKIRYRTDEIKTMMGMKSLIPELG